MASRVPAPARRATLLLTLVCLATLMAVPARAQTPPPSPYAALGDSYSAGEGLDPYLPGSDTAANHCHRSPLAYPAQLGGGELRFIACSGAAIANLMPGGPAQWDEGAAQLDRGVLGTTVGLVTLTIGGNDAQFTPTLQQCAFRNCLKLLIDELPYPEWLSRRIDGLAAPLADLYTAVADRAPAARVIVLGYPNIFPATPGEQGCWSLFPWNAGEQAFIRDAGARLEGVSRAAAAAAAAAGRNVEFVPMADRFAGHEACGAGGEWISGPVRTQQEQSFQPLREGQAAYAAAVGERLGAPPAPLRDFAAPELPVPEGPAPGSFGRLTLRPAGGDPGCRWAGPGRPVTATADGLAPGAAVRLTLTPLGGAEQPWGQAVADAAGRATATLVMPARGLLGRPVLAEARGEGADGGPRIETETLRVLPEVPAVCGPS